ncbi:putative flavonol 3-O-glucosyltransferase [Rosa chinensis]|uniref:Putative flavonol 3-O-glucosyltransferase n=1 Tax=Rosa chinensis TaxID=74649 RepID=A0A2P6S0M0_ROSCH|nr:putative flavonol 3-O-glucosyltransferase [Rosa chinensis]
MLGLVFHFQVQRDQYSKDYIEFKDSDAELLILSFVNPLPAAVLPDMLLVKKVT